MALVLINLSLVILFLAILLNFGGYTALLRGVTLFRKVDHEINEMYLPEVTILIAAYNEEAVIQEKLQNSVALDYPVDLLRIMVVSDGSQDNTNEIVEQFDSPLVELIAVQQNKGKASALNQGMEKISSEIVLLSDANVMYQEDAIRKLVRHFSDDTIGAVSGMVVLLNEGLSYSDAENSYYSVEHNIQQLESDTGNLIGADGAMYAIRRDLFRPLKKDTLLDDFVLSMGVIQQRKRLVFDAQALGYEKNLAEMDSEFTRKVRIVAGGMQCLKRKTVWPPRGHILTATKLTCHKILRWFIGPMLLLFIGLLLLRGLIANDTTSLVLAAASIAGLLTLQLVPAKFPSLLNFKLFNILNYLNTMIKASVVGCYKGLASNQKIRWR